MTLKEFFDVWNDQEDTLLVHTSGSTGEPKPLLVEKKRMMASAKMTCNFLNLKQGNVALLCMPLDYIAGKMMVVRALVAQMSLVAIVPTGHPMADEMVSGLEIDLAAMVPLQVYNTLKVPEEWARLKRVKHLLIGGGALDAQLEEQLRSFPFHVWATYGMTETLSHIALRKVNGDDATPWFSPMPGVEVSTDEDGCLLVNAPALCPSVLATNDIVEMHSDGKRFKVLGRKDNVICTGGIKVQMEQVEAALKPYITQPFFITKAKDEKFGEIPVLVVEKGDKKQLEDIISHILPKYSKPKKIILVDQIPLTETGKPKRFEIC